MAGEPSLPPEKENAASPAGREGAREDEAVLDEKGVEICAGTSCWLCGGKSLHDAMKRRGAGYRRVYCLGYCDRSPVLLDRDRKPRFRGAARCFAEGGEGSSDASLPTTRCHGVTPVVTRRLLKGGATPLEAARQHGAYEGFQKALSGGPAAVLAALDRSGLAGRAGGAFAAGRMWRACAEAPADRPYVIANGDEGDPGSFIDRVLMEEDPHGILEGMLLCGFTVGASEGIAFIRSEYPRATEVMRGAIDEARAAGWLGRNIRDSGFDFDVSVCSGTGSYVCGGESALLKEIEGKRGAVRPPATGGGLHGRPAVIHDVETLVNLPFIVADGGKKYASLGSPGSRGTKALCLNRGFARPGIVEVEFGTSLRVVIEELAGGGHGGKPLAAVLIGGPMGSVLTPGQWDVPVCHAAMRERGIELGHGGLVAVPEDADFRGLLEQWLRFMIDVSCEKCVPCRLEPRWVANVLRAGNSEDEIRRRLDELFTLMEHESACDFGRRIPTPLRQLIHHFGERIFRLPSAG